MNQQWKPNTTVAAIIEDDGRFLLVEEEADGDVLFNQPAGHLEYGETLLDAARREVLEETGHVFEPQSLVGVYLYPNPRVDIVYLRFCFAGTVQAPLETPTLDDGIIRTLWLNRDEIGELGDRLRSDMVPRCIDDYLASNRYPLDMLHHINL